MEQQTRRTLNQLSENLFSFLSKKEAKKHLNQLFTTYLNSADADDLNDRQKKLFIHKQLKKIIKNLAQ